MTRIFVQRGLGGSSSNANRPPSSSLPQPSAPSTAAAAPLTREEEQEKDAFQEHGVSDGAVEQPLDDNSAKNDVFLHESAGCIRPDRHPDERADKEKSAKVDPTDTEIIVEEIEGLQIVGSSSGQTGVGSSQIVTAALYPPPPPVPPPKPSGVSTSLRRTSSGSSNSVRIGSSRRPSAWPPVLSRSSGSGSRPSSPRSLAESEGYNSADEQGPCYVSTYDDAERERLFELELRRVKGFEIRRMLEDGNCLFRAIADQVYGDPEAYDMARQMCVDYMERERDHFSQFITEGFTSYCKRKRRDKVYGNNVEIQAFAEMYNRPIHIYSYSTEPINIFQGSYATDTPPIRLSFHHGNHYNSLVDPRRTAIGAGLGFSSLRGVNVGRDQVKAAIKAQQDQQIDNALLAEGRFYSDLELTEKEIERMVMEASRAEYLAEEKLKQQLAYRESSTSGAEPSSSGTITGSSRPTSELVRVDKVVLPDMVLTGSMQLLLAMGFSYIQVIEAYSIFGDDVDSMICYLVEMGASGASPGASNRQKGKAAE